MTEPAKPAQPAEGTPAPVASAPASSAAAPAPAQSPQTPTPTPLAPYELKVAEGGDPSVAATWAKQAHTLGIAADKAQALFDAHTAASTQREKEAREGWIRQAQQDPEIGGAKLNESVAIAQKAMQRFASPKFVQFLQQTGLDSHPEMVRVFRAVGAAISPDAKIVTGAPPGAQGDNKAALKQWYSKSQMA